MDPSQNPMLALGMSGQPNPSSMPLGATQDPRSQYLAMALAQANKSGQNPGGPMGLSAGLLASALDRYGMRQQAQPQGYYMNDQGQRMANPGTPAPVPM